MYLAKAAFFSFQFGDSILRGPQHQFLRWLLPTLDRQAVSCMAAKRPQKRCEVQETPLASLLVEQRQNASSSQ